MLQSFLLSLDGKNLTVRLKSFILSFIFGKYTIEFLQFMFSSSPAATLLFSQINWSDIFSNINVWYIRAKTLRLSHSNRLVSSEISSVLWFLVSALVAGASSVIALGIGLLIGAFAINTGDGNEFAYQVKIKKVLKISILVQNCIFVDDFCILIKRIRRQCWGISQKQYWQYVHSQLVRLVFK